jgi:hypothetical protein
MKDHVKVIGILWIVFGTFWLCLAVLALLVFLGVALIPDVEGIGPDLLRIIGIAVSIFFGVLGLPQIIGGLALLKGKEWGRILVLVMAFLALVNVPLGTALGIYTMVILFNPETVRLFQGLPPAGPAPPK